jgi:hypothetical protein
MCAKLLKASVVFGLLAILLGMPLLLTPHRIRPSVGGCGHISPVPGPANDVMICVASAPFDVAG